MIKYTPERSVKFRKDYRRMKKRGYNMSLLDNVITRLANGEPLPPRYEDHPLKGNRKGYRGCHILPDWVLIYKIDKGNLILILTETGSHADLLE